MLLGIGSYTYTWAVGVPGSEPEQPLDALGLIGKAVELGVGVVQICDNLPLHKLSDDELDALDRRAREAGILIEVGTRGVAPEHLRTYLAIARRLGSPIVRVVVDTAEHKPSLAEVVSLIGEVSVEFRAAGVRVAIENHDRFCSCYLTRIVEDLGTGLAGICLDTVNSFGALEGPEVVVDTLAPYTINLHVKDFIVRRADHQMGFAIEGVPAGSGRLDIPWLFTRVARTDPNAILELWTPPEESVEATIAKEDRWARESIAYLKQLSAISRQTDG